VEDHVQFAEAIDRRLHQGFHGSVLGDVAMHVHHVLRMPGLQGGPEVVLDVTDDDTGAFGNEQFDAAQTDAAGTAGDSRAFSRQPCCHSLSPLFCPATGRYSMGSMITDV